MNDERIVEVLEDAITDGGYWHLPAGQIEKGLAALRAADLDVVDLSEHKQLYISTAQAFQRGVKSGTYRLVPDREAS